MPQYRVRYTSYADPLDRLTASFWAHTDLVFAQDQDDLQRLFERLGRHILTAEPYSAQDRRLKQLRVPLPQLLSYVSQLSLLVGRGQGVNQATAYLASQLTTVSSKLKLLATSLADALNNESHLPHEAFARMPRCFPPEMVGAIKAGESGNMPAAIEQVRTQVVRAIEMNDAAKKITIYPKIVLTIAAIASHIVFVFVMPTFRGVFEELNVELPALTKGLFAVSDFIGAHVLPLTLGLAVPIGLFLMLRDHPLVKGVTDWAALKVPWIGSAIVSLESSRVAGCMATLTQAGESFTSTLAIAATSPANSYFRRCILKAAEAASHSPVPEALRKAGVLEDIFVATMDAAVTAGDNGKAAEQLQAYYAADAKSRVDRLLAVAGPVVIVVMGAAIGTFVIGILTPLLTMAFEMKL